jgi:hypothetical protein
VQFKVNWARYQSSTGRLEFAASGVQKGVRFTVVTHVRCLKDPVTPENTHIVALLRLTEIFRRPSASGR